jgi:hypothetical protein
MSNRLLQRQIRLLEYLTSVDAIFEDRGIPPAANGLEGLDPGRLALEARFSFEKRLEKISAVFPRTFAVRSSDWAPILEKFVEEHPPSDICKLACRQVEQELAHGFASIPARPDAVSPVRNRPLRERAAVF